MITRIFFFLIGVLFMTVGFSYIIVYLNLLSFGYTISEYLQYIITRYECILLLVGFIIVLTSVLRKGNKNDKCIRHSTKSTR